MAVYDIVKLTKETAQGDDRLIIEIFERKGSPDIDMMMKGRPVKTFADSMQTFRQNPSGIVAVMFYAYGDMAYLELEDGNVYKAVKVSGETGIPRRLIEEES
jgi:hypothetical protein